jgi:tetratricopeptide (TPR) repeat protein
VGDDDKLAAGTEAKRAQARELLERGREHQREGCLDSAVDCYRRSIAIAATSLAHTLLGSVLAHSGRIDEAIEECHAAIRLDPECGNAWQDLGAYHMEKGDSQRGASYLRRALAMPRLERHPYAHVNLGRVYVKQGLCMRALDEFRAALALEPRDVCAKKAIREITRNFN